MSDPNEAYLKVKKMIEAAESNKQMQIPNISLTDIEERVLGTAIRNKIMQHASLPEHHADLVSDHIIMMVQDFLAQKLQNMKQKQNNLQSPVFRRSEE